MTASSAPAPWPTLLQWVCAQVSQQDTIPALCARSAGQRWSVPRRHMRGTTRARAAPLQRCADSPRCGEGHGLLAPDVGSHNGLPDEVSSDSTQQFRSEFWPAHLHSRPYSSVLPIDVQLSMCMHTAPGRLLCSLLLNLQIATPLYQ